MLNDTLPGNIVISVVIPTRHRNDLLERCLSHLFESLPINAQVEIIVTDDGSSSTAQFLIEEKFPSVHWIVGPRKGPAANRNCGASFANGSWLVFLDDDCIPSAGWLAAIFNKAREADLDVIEGKTEIPDKVDHPFRRGVENLTGNCYWSCNLAIRRTSFERIGRFDEDFSEAGGEDMEFAYRIKKNKLKSIFLSDAVVLHPTRELTWQSIIWQSKLNRWILLYQYKTDKGTPLCRPLIVALFHAGISRIIHIMRTTWHLFSRPSPILWRTRCFDQAWAWISLPFFLPYMIFWEYKFRRMLIERQVRSDA